MQRTKGRGIKAVVENADAPDCKGIGVYVSNPVPDEGTSTTTNYVPRIAGLLGTPPLIRSAYSDSNARWTPTSASLSATPAVTGWVESSIP